jgi:ABC-type multidrug transport system fused ATPase/permease subunit
MLPVFVIPARFMGRKLQAITREGYNLNAKMNTTMTERFNVSGALLVKLFGRPTRRPTVRTPAGRVRDIGVTQAMYSRHLLRPLSLVAALATAITYGIGGRLAAERSLQVGTLVALTAYLGRLYGPLTALSNVRVDIMTALVSFERVFEVLDLPPAIVDKPDAVATPTGAHDRVPRRRLPLPVGRGGLAGVAGVGRGARYDRAAAGALRRLVHGGARSARRARRSVRAGQDDDHPARHAPVRRAGGRRLRIGGVTCATSRSSRYARRSAS